MFDCGGSKDKYFCGSVQVNSVNLCMPSIAPSMCYDVARVPSVQLYWLSSGGAVVRCTILPYVDKYDSHVLLWKFFKKMDVMFPASQTQQTEGR